MKKYGIIAMALFLAAACNSNKDKEATPDQTEPATTTGNQANTTVAYPLSGKFEIIDYKKDNVKIDLPKTIVEFTAKGDVIKSDGVTYLYKVEGDSILFLTSPDKPAYTSKIDFLNNDKTSFVVKTALDKTEITYKKQ